MHGCISFPASLRQNCCDASRPVIDLLPVHVHAANIRRLLSGCRPRVAGLDAFGESLLGRAAALLAGLSRKHQISTRDRNAWIYRLYTQFAQAGRKRERDRARERGHGLQPSVGVLLSLFFVCAGVLERGAKRDKTRVGVFFVGRTVFEKRNCKLHQNTPPS